MFGDCKVTAWNISLYYICSLMQFQSISSQYPEIYLYIGDNIVLLQQHLIFLIAHKSIQTKQIRSLNGTLSLPYSTRIIVCQNIWVKYTNHLRLHSPDAVYFTTDKSDTNSRIIFIGSSFCLVLLLIMKWYISVSC